MFTMFLSYFVKVTVCSGMSACIAKTKRDLILAISYLIFQLTIQHSKRTCKIYFTITLMLPGQIWPNIILADKNCIQIGFEVTIDL